MKYGRKIVGSMLLLLLFSACGRKSTNSERNVLFNVKYGNQHLQLNNVYATSTGDSVRFMNLKLYLSDIELLKADGSSVEVKHIFYFSYGNNSQKTYQIPEDTYTGIRFNFGLTDEQNSNDSTTVVWPNPLCVDNGMWWNETLKYTWIAMDGGVKPSGMNEFRSLLYHIGTTTNRRTITIQQTIRVSGNNSNLCTLNLDVQKIIDGENPMNMMTENRSETTNFPIVAQKFSDNIMHAFSISQQ